MGGNGIQRSSFRAATLLPETAGGRGPGARGQNGVTIRAKCQASVPGQSGGRRLRNSCWVDSLASRRRWTRFSASGHSDTPGLIVFWEGTVVHALTIVVLMSFS